MKKYLFLATALTVMGCGMTSCSSDAEDVIEQNEQAPKLTKLVFTVAQDAETRVKWDGPSGRTPMFENNDEVSLFSANNDNVKLTAHVADGVVTLEGEGAADEELYFVYPWNDNVHMDMGTKKITSSTAPAYNLNVINESPYLRKFASDVFGINKYPANALSLAKSTDGGRVALTFKGLMAIIKFTPTYEEYAEYVSTLMIRAYEDNDEATTFKGGQLTINAAGETPTIESTQNSYGICFRKSDVGTFVVGNTYYVALPPTGPMSGWTYISDQFDEITQNTLSAGFTFEAGKIYSVTNP